MKSMGISSAETGREHREIPDWENAIMYVFLIRHGSTNKKGETKDKSDWQRSLTDKGIGQVATGMKELLEQIPNLQDKALYIHPGGTTRLRTHQSAPIAGDVIRGLEIKTGEEAIAELSKRAEEGEETFTYDMLDLGGVEADTGGAYGALMDAIYEGTVGMDGKEIPKDQRDPRGGPAGRWLVNHSDRVAVESGAGSAEPYTAVAGRVAEFMLHNFDRADQWAKALQAEGKDLENSAVVKPQSSHGSIGECFLLKLAEIQGGESARDQLLEKLEKVGGPTGMFVNGKGLIVGITGKDSAIVRWEDETWTVTRADLEEMVRQRKELKQAIADSARKQAKPFEMDKES